MPSVTRLAQFFFFFIGHFLCFQFPSETRLSFDWSQHCVFVIASITRLALFFFTSFISPASSSSPLRHLRHGSSLIGLGRARSRYPTGPIFFFFSSASSLPTLRRLRHGSSLIGARHYAVSSYHPASPIFLISFILLCAVIEFLFFMEDDTAASSCLGISIWFLTMGRLLDFSLAPSRHHAPFHRPFSLISRSECIPVPLAGSWVTGSRNLSPTVTQLACL